MNRPFNFFIIQLLNNIKPVPLVARRLHGRRSAQAGLSLVELMISLTIGLFLVVGLATLFASMSSTRSELDKSSRQIENGRYAIQILSDEVRHAGYYGALSSAPKLPSTVGSLPDPCSTALSDVQNSIGLPLQGYAGAATAESVDPGNLECLTNYKANTAVLVVRRAGTAILGFTPNTFNIQVSGCAGDTAPYVLNSASSAFTLHKNASPGCIPITSAPLADIAPYETRIFFISSCSLLTSGGACNDSVPTLKRIDVNSTGTLTTALVEGIENIQFDYGIDDSLTGNGVPDLYTNTSTHAAITPSSMTEWQNVMTVRVHVLARNIDQTTGYTDPKTYQIGPVSVTPGGAYKRHAYSELVRINNPAGRRVPP